MPADLAEECPVAFSYCGIPHAVMMATPEDLEDFALGFSITDGIVATRSDIRKLSVLRQDAGLKLDIDLTPSRLAGFLSRTRARSLRSHSSCGVCGVQDLENVPGCARLAVPSAVPSHTAIRRALEELPHHQPLSRQTHCAHAAAWADQDGALLDVREDIGRHNALDKLIGAALRLGRDRASGFCIVTSRCSFEMVQKSVAAGFGVLVALSAPTALAVQAAQQAGLMIVANAGRRPVTHEGQAW